MEIWEIKDKNKLVFAVDAKYKEVLIYICKSELRAFHGVPLTHEDLYYGFLAEVHTFVFEFDPKADTNFKTYITIKCKYFCKVFCRKYWSKNDAVMNNYVEWDEKYAQAHDVQLEEKKFNIGLLDEKEFEYFKLRFLQGKQIGEVCIQMNINRYKANEILKGIMLKVKSNQKN